MTHRFKKRFLETTVPYVSEAALRDLANERSLRKNTDADEEFERTMKEYDSKGALVYTFDSGTGPAIKQYREKLLMGNIGSINFECDEVASNLLSNKEIVDMYLELYDGTVKQKLVKNTQDNKRSEEIDGITPTNMLMFGEGSLLFDGASNEALITNLFTTGYARRCFFGYSDIELTRNTMTPQERLAMLTDNSTDVELARLSVVLEKLADSANHGITIQVPDDVMLLLVEYQMHCEAVEMSFKTMDTIRRAEARGRFFKTLKLAAAFTWLDSLNTMTMEHMEAAIKLAEESAQSFHRMLTRPPVYARLAQYLSECTNPMTHAELMEALPYYPKAATAQKEIIRNTVAWGHRNNVIIKRSITDDIEFIQGEALQETDIDQLILSHSTDFANGYKPETKVPFDKLSVVTQNPSFHWCAHRFVGGHRHTTKAIQGFNLLVLDIDSGCTINEAETVLADYKYHIYTSKSHLIKNDKNPNGDERFRIVIPMSHHLKMDPETYKEFMGNIFEFLPFPSDEATGEIARKWESCKSTTVITKDTGKLFDVLPFIPKTKKNQERQEAYKAIEGTTGIQRWFLARIIDKGERNNHLQRFGYMLIDGGYDLHVAQLHVRELNEKLPEPLDELELQKTVYNSMGTHHAKKG